MKLVRLVVLATIVSLVWISFPASVDAVTCDFVAPGAGRIPIRQKCPAIRGPEPTQQVASPLVEGPVTGGSGSPTIQGVSFDLSEVGYGVEEYFLSGIANAYLNTNSLRSDGKWSIAPANQAEYKTRIVVYRPLDDEEFSGLVVVEWLNVSGGLDAAPDWTMLQTEITREGHAYVGVSAQIVGIEGRPGGGPIPGLELFLKGADPDRYGSLSHPGDSYSYDMYSQVGQALRNPNGVDPLHGLSPTRIIAIGESQSAFRMTTYVNAFAPIHGMYDAYFVHSRGGGAAPLSQEPEPEVEMPNVVRIRTDLDVPVLTYQTETDIFRLGFLPDRQPDTAGHRLWEVAGSAHADTYTLMVGFTDTGNDPSSFDVVVTDAPIPGIIECDSPINSGPQHVVLKAALAALDRWVRTGQAPRRAARLEVTSDGEEFVLDEYGNVEGGIRSSWVDAPVATLSGLGQSGGSFCGIFGTTVAFDDATLAELYPDHETYVRRVRSATSRAVFQGFIRPADGDLIIEGARQSGIGG